MLGQLEREPGEYVVDPWVTARQHTLVAVHRERTAGAAHLLRYADDERVNTSRGAGEIRWLLFWPGQNPAKAEMVAVADGLAAAAVAHLRGCPRTGADFGLPAPAVWAATAHVSAPFSMGR